MRTAVALPSLVRESPLRRCLDDVVGALAARGLEIEAFAEMDRVREGAKVPLFHYLRFEERHRSEPFRAALWPLGRDVRTWEPAWILSSRFPGTAWMLDEPVHHAAMGGIALPGHWGLYGRLLEAAFDDPSPAFSLFAAGWASRAAYRSHDPMRRRLERQGDLVGAMPGPGQRSGGRAGAGPVPLPAAAGAADESPVHPPGEDRVAIVSMDVIRPGAVMAALGEVVAGRPGLEVSIAIPEPTYHVRVAPAAHRAGVADRVRWLLSPEPRQVLRELRRASIVVFLDVEVSAGDRALLEYGLGLGKAAIAMDIRRLGDVPAPPLLKLRSGAALGPGLAVALGELLDDRRFRDALGDAAKRWLAGRPGAAEIARRLEPHLGRGPDAAPGAEDRTRPVWTGLREDMRQHCLPTSGVHDCRELVADLLERILPGRQRRGCADSSR